MERHVHHDEPQQATARATLSVIQDRPTTAATVRLRIATMEDADSVADVYLRSRKELVACAPLVHSDEAVREWVRRSLIPAGGTTVAIVDDQIVGLLAVSQGTDCGWIDQLYLVPTWIGHGIGSSLLNLARSELSPPIRLYTFQCNERARRFYERHGFEAIAYGDGSDNEEGCPDILYAWRQTGARATDR